MTKLQGKVALVTGGSDGIGRCVCQTLAREGAHVAVVASRDIDKAQSVVDDIAQNGGNARAYAANIADVSAVRGLVEAVAKDLGGIDIVVCAAGVLGATPVGATEEAEYDRIMDVNVKGAYFTVDAAATHLKAAAGKVVLFSSSAAWLGSSPNHVYGMSKAALLYLVKSFTAELGPHNVNVNAIAPGMTATAMNETYRTSEQTKSVRDYEWEHTPSSRPWSEPQDIANGVLFLVSDESRAMQGTHLLMDEGRICNFWPVRGAMVEDIEL
ncbi:MAG: SDR family oxidoreductase [Pseudomonadota bacterium]